MANRRKFFKWTLGITALGVVAPTRAAEMLRDIEVNLQDKTVEVKPKIVSTWDFGKAANSAAWKILKKGGTSLDAVEAGARQTESDAGNHSVGLGGLPDEKGDVTLDACIMTGNAKCGSVAFLEDIAHPISVARKIMETTPHVMLVGEGARRFALKNGFEKIKLLTKEAKGQYKAWKKEQVRKRPEINHENHDTIGLLAMDNEGVISGACTTSGWGYKLQGRVGDSPIIGSGLFIDDEVGGAVATGLGEAVIRIAGSHTVVELMRSGKSPNEACKLAVERVLAKHDNHDGLQVGFLAMNKDGVVGAYSVYNGFKYAYKDELTEDLIEAKSNRKW